MRFDELVIKIEDEELRLPFHPELTILSGLGVLERQSLSDSILGALTAGEQPTALRYTDGSGRAATLVCRDGRAEARYDDDRSPAPTPVGTIASSPAALRQLLLVRASDLGVLDATPREDEPEELTEARATLVELTEELDAVLTKVQLQTELRSRLHELDEQIAAARDGEARREYATVLARLERVRSEAAAVQSGAQSIESDKKLLAASEEAHELAGRWRDAAQQLTALTSTVGEARLDAELLDRSAAIPDHPPDDLDHHIAAVNAAQADRDALDHRLQELAVATLPAPSDPAVAELGLIEQDPLWGTAERLLAAIDEIERLQVAHGGLGGEESGPGPAVLEEIEAAHTALEEAEQAAEAKRIPGVATSGLGVALALAGVISSAALIALGLVLALGAGLVMLVLPKQRVASAARTELEALTRADATSYLGFHIRRVDASIDPRMREQVALAMVEQRRAADSWSDLVGSDIDVRHASTLEQEARAYHKALRDLGGAADEIEELRRELATRAEPALAAAQDELRSLCRPYDLAGDDLEGVTDLHALVASQIELGSRARSQLEIEKAEEDEHAAAGRLDELLLRLGFGEGDRDARLKDFEWASGEAADREAARARARPMAEIEGEQRELESTCRSLRRPEWDTVTADEAETPDPAELEAQRDELAEDLDDTVSEHDVERLADRQAAVDRRVAALEARYGGNQANGDPGALADMQQHLLSRLSAASQAGPQGDSVPMILDEAFLRVPADRKWDLLDLLLRLAENHQLIYMSDDAFVAAWARQQAADGRVTLLEPAPA